MKYLFPLFLFTHAFFIAFGQVDSTLGAVQIRTEPIRIIAAPSFIVKSHHIQNSLILSQSIQFENPANTADMLQQTGRVLVQKSQAGGGSPILRGMEANKILLLVDGVRMNNAIYRGGHLQNVLRVDPNMINHTQISFGSASSLYGSDALGGALHFHLQRALLRRNIEEGDKPLSAQYKIRFSSAPQEMMQHAAINWAGKKWASLSAFTLSSFGDMRQGRNKNPLNQKYSTVFDRTFYVDRIDGKDSTILQQKTHIQTPTAYKQYNAYQNLIFQQNEHIRHQISGYFSTTSEVPRYDRLTEMKNGTPTYAQWAYGPEKWAMLRYELQALFMDKWIDRLSCIAATQHIRESRISRRFASAKQKNQVEQVAVQSVNISAYKRKGKHQFSGGIETNWNQVKSRAFTRNIDSGALAPSDTRYPDGRNKTWNGAVFVGDVMEFNHQWKSDIGLRYTRNSLYASFTDSSFFQFPFPAISQQSGAMSGNLSLIYYPVPRTMVSWIGTTGYRVPNIDDAAKVFESISGALIVPNSGLKPEYTYNTELHFRQKFAQTWVWEAVGYYTQLKNLITVAKSTFENKDSILYDGAQSAIFSSQNKGRAFVYGLFSAIEGELGSHWRLFANVNYTYGRILTDSAPTPLDHIPPLYGNMGVSYQGKKYKVALSSFWNGAKKVKDYNLNGEDNFQYATPEGMPAWVAFHLKSEIYVKKDMLLHIGVENILDTQYRIFASGVSAAGRNIYLGLQTKF